MEGGDRLPNALRGDDKSPAMRTKTSNNENTVHMGLRALG
jgi:hypothetical protein